MSATSLTSLELHQASLQMTVLDKHPTYPIATANRRLMRQVVAEMESQRCSDDVVVNEWLARQMRMREPARDVSGRWQR